MKKHVLTVIFMTVLAAAIGCKESQPVHKGCTDSGGTITTVNCCGLTGDFPNTCAVGACGCAPQYSHEVYVCDCGADKCFDGAACVNAKIDDGQAFLKLKGRAANRKIKFLLHEQQPQGRGINT